MPWLKAEHAVSLPCNVSLESFVVATNQPAREVISPLIQLPWENGTEVVFTTGGWQGGDDAGYSGGILDSFMQWMCGEMTPSAPPFGTPGTNPLPQWQGTRQQASRYTASPRCYADWPRG